MGAIQTTASKRETVGRNIRRLRERHGLSQKELGEKVGLSQQALSGIERGLNFPELSAVIRFSDFFGVDFNQLLQ